MRPLPYKHYFTVSDGIYVWEDPQTFEVKRKILEGKRGHAIIEEETEDASPKMLAYYFGGIIRQECMRSNCFAGLSEKDIHNYLLLSVRGSMRRICRPDGSVSLVEMPGDFERIMDNKKEMTNYINEVIIFLNTEHQIYPKPSEHYKKTNRFRSQEKHY